jgi:hypothetical protein
MSHDEVLEITGAASALGRNGHLLELGAARLLAGELTGAVQAELDAHLAGCAGCATYLDEIRAEDQRLGPALPAIAPPRWARDHRRPIAALGTGLAAAAAVLLWLRHEPSGGLADQPSIRNKGHQLVLIVHAHDGTRDRLVGPHDRVRPGERLGFEIAAPAGGYLIIVGIDGTGVSYPCYPQGPEGQAVRLAPTSALTALPAAIELDDVSDHERIIGILCPAPFTRADVERAPRVKREGCVQTEVSLIKAVP